MTESIKYFVQHMDDANVTNAQREAYTDAIVALQRQEKIGNINKCGTCKNRRKDDKWCDLLDTVVGMEDFCSFAK